ncbi:MAG: homoserine O-acetyltransferase [Thermoguttaceae bacterium]|nr:homoserine O-acetyltransferase [Thermoguttaceae bacterium]MCR5359543.1 homoserine O-acetyltransferase [Thermoguttaceae bacterium]
MADDFFDSSDSDRSNKPLLHAERWTLPEPLALEGGGVLENVTVVYETYGRLNAEKSNAIFICHALSGDSHVASHDADDDPGWWELMVGPGRPIDTNRYFVVCANILGGCRGTTGPEDVNPATGVPYGKDFPAICIADIVNVNHKLICGHFGIPSLFALVGGSLGGFMALDWAVRYPDSLYGSIMIATGARLSQQSRAFDVIARNAITSDPNFCDGQYYDKKVGPKKGLAIARQLGHITYLSREAMNRKSASDRKVDSPFETIYPVGSYLAHQGDKFVERFDANSYCTLSIALDDYNQSQTFEDLTEDLKKSRCRWLCVSFSSDWLFVPSQTKEIVDAALAAGKEVSYCNVASEAGHDGFLLKPEIDFYGQLVSAFLRNLESNPQVSVHKEPNADPAEFPEKRPVPYRLKHRIDFDRILELIPPGKSVLDLGCGKGELLLRLRQRGDETLLGVELEQKCVLQCIQRDLNVIHTDMDKGLRSFRNNQFDFVVLSKTLQTVRNVELVLSEMLRIGRTAIVSFPNFGYHRFRTQLEMFGTAPQTDTRPGRKWFNTNDVRFLTIADFRELCNDKRYRIQKMIALDTEREIEIPEEESPNVLADVAIIALTK